MLQVSIGSFLDPNDPAQPPLEKKTKQPEPLQPAVVSRESEGLPCFLRSFLFLGSGKQTHMYYNVIRCPLVNMSILWISMFQFAVVCLYAN